MVLKRGLTIQEIELAIKVVPVVDTLSLIARHFVKNAHVYLVNLSALEIGSKVFDLLALLFVESFELDVRKQGVIRTLVKENFLILDRSQRRISSFPFLFDWSDKSTSFLFSLA